MTMTNRIHARLSDEHEVDSFHLERYRFAALFARGDVLDVACGIGYGSSMLKEAGADYVLGVDASHEAIEYAEDHYDAAGLEFQVSDCFDIQGEYDLVVSLETIEHLQRGNEWPDKIASMLKSPGTAIISTPCRIGGTLDDTPSNPYHVREYSPDEFSELLEASFDEVRLHFQGFRMPNARGGAISRIAQRLFLYLRMRKSVKEPQRPVLTAGEWFERYDCKPTFMIAECRIR